MGGLVVKTYPTVHFLAHLAVRLMRVSEELGANSNFGTKFIAQSGRLVEYHRGEGQAWQAANTTTAPVKVASAQRDASRREASGGRGARASEPYHKYALPFASIDLFLHLVNIYRSTSRW